MNKWFSNRQDKCLYWYSVRKNNPKTLLCNTRGSEIQESGSVVVLCAVLVENKISKKYENDRFSYINVNIVEA